MRKTIKLVIILQCVKAMLEGQVIWEHRAGTPVFYTETLRITRTSLKGKEEEGVMEREHYLHERKGGVEWG